MFKNYKMENNKLEKLAINGGKPVTEKPVLIHKPYLDEEDFKAVEIGRAHV